MSYTITQTLTAYTGLTQSVNHNYNTAIKTAIQYQQKIEIDMMVRGFLSKQWLNTIYPSRNPAQTMNKLQQLIWMEFFEPLWKNRNELLHRTINFFTQADGNILAESIKWYCKKLPPHTCTPRHTFSGQHWPLLPPVDALKTKTRMGMTL
jgi:hypothetical protein